MEGKERQGREGRERYPVVEGDDDDVHVGGLDELGAVEVWIGWLSWVRDVVEK